MVTANTVAASPARITHLILSRKVDESIRIGANIEICVSKVAGKRVTFSLRVPADVKILRDEIAETPPRAA